MYWRRKVCVCVWKEVNRPLTIYSLPQLLTPSIGFSCCSISVHGRCAPSSRWAQHRVVQVHRCSWSSFVQLHALDRWHWLCKSWPPYWLRRCQRSPLYSWWIGCLIDDLRNKKTKEPLLVHKWYIHVNPCNCYNISFTSLSCGREVIVVVVVVVAFFWSGSFVV